MQVPKAQKRDHETGRIYSLACACRHTAVRGQGRPSTRALLKRIGADVEAGGPTWNILGPYSAEPPDAAVALRFLGAVHRLVLVRPPTRHWHV